MRIRILFLALIAQAFSLLPSFAQVSITGTPPFGSFGGGPDIINLSNLNMHIDVPMVNRPGRRLNFVYEMSYDSTVWTAGGTTAVTNWGWRAVDEAEFGYITYSTSTQPCTPTGNQTIYSGWIYHDAHGTQHSFAFSIGTNGTGCAPEPSNATGTASDGSGYMMSASVGSPCPTASVTSKAGDVIVPETVGHCTGNGGNGGSITDSNGNEITADFIVSHAFTDTLGTTALTYAGSGTPSSPTTFTYTAASGSSATYTISYKTYGVMPNFQCSNFQVLGKQYSLVDRITLPDNTFYQFAYEPTPGNPGDVTGRLASVTLPAGGTISYTYTGPNNGLICADGTAAGLTRTTPDGTWTYTRAIGPGAASTTTISDPQGNQTVIQFQGTYETERQVYSGSSSSGTLLDTVYTCYNGASYPCNSTAITLPITQTAKTNSWASGQTAQTVSSYNAYGLTTEVDEYGYGNGSPGALVRKTTTTYASLGNNINDRPSQVSVYAAGATNPTSQTSYTYDQGSVTSTSGTPQHVSVSGSRGNATTTSYLVSPSTTIGYTATYYDTGTVNTSADSNNNNTTYTYGTSSCGNSFPTTISLPLNLSRSKTWNCNGGLIASQTDENGQVASFSYDLMNRPIQTDLPDGGWKLTTYTGANQRDTYTGITDTTPSSSCTSCKHDQLNLDSQGRPSTTILVNDPEGQTTSSTAYDSLGRVQKRSNPYRTTSDPTYGFNTNAYDALNRVTSVTHQDNNVVSTYYGAGVGSHGGTSSQLCASGTYGLGYPTLMLDESGMKHQTWSDALSRIIEADEPDSSDNMTLATCHVYDALNNLAQTVQGSQTRTYAYDGLSRKTSESTPEGGTTNLYYTTSGGALCSGNAQVVCRRTDARSITTTYSYDALSRLTSRTYSDSTPAANFYYDESSVTIAGTQYTLTNTKGRMSHTSAASGAAMTLHSYDKMGRTQDLWQCTPYNCSSTSIWQAHYVRDLGGNLTSWQHPNGETITQTFSNAQRITQITSSLNDSTHAGTLAQNIHYAPQGAIASLRDGCAGSGCTQEQETYDYNNRLEIVRTQLGTSANPNANACTVYNYYSGLANPTTCSIPSQASSGNDGSEMGHYFQDTTNSSLGHTATYTYDNINRLLTSVATGSSTHNLTFSYDRYGNMTCVTNGQTNGLCPNNTFNTSTNQINNTGFTYDSAGNLTADGTGTGSHTYQWDAENRLKSIDSGSTATYTYNAIGRRVEKLVGSTYTEYAYQAFGEDLGENNRTRWTARVIPFAGRHLAHYNDPSGTDAAYFMHSTRIGSTSQVTDYSGSLAQDQLFYPWGQEWKMAGTAQEMRFASLGHRDMTETGLDPTQFRIFSSTQGRWLGKDPLPGKVCSPQSMNLYAYVRNSPPNDVDPRGLFRIGIPGIPAGGGGSGPCDPLLNPNYPEGCPDPGPCTDPLDPYCGGTYPPGGGAPPPTGGGGGGGGGLGSGCGPTDFCCNIKYQCAFECGAIGILCLSECDKAFPLPILPIQRIGRAACFATCAALTSLCYYNCVKAANCPPF